MHLLPKGACIVVSAGLWWFFYLLCWVVFFFTGVLVVRRLVFICLYSVDLLAFIMSVVGGWLSSLVS